MKFFEKRMGKDDMEVCDFCRGWIKPGEVFRLNDVGKRVHEECSG